MKSQEMCTSDHKRELVAAANANKLMQPMEILIIMATFNKICYVVYYIKI